MQAFIEELVSSCRKYTAEGEVATYIPELGKHDKHDLGVYLMTAEGGSYAAGEWDTPFTMQSMVKPFLLLLALKQNGADYICRQMSVEATGKPFDAINMTDQKLLREHVNPMVNMGAIELCTMIRGKSVEDRFDQLLRFIRTLAGNDSIALDERVYLSERATGNKNKALAYMLKAYGLIEEDPMQVLELYFRACSIRVNCRDLARMALTLAEHGGQAQQYFTEEQARFVNAILLTCGMYDGSGEFAVRVGVPAKSGVSGGIFSVVPGKMGIAIYSPALDKKGNSVAGIRLLEELSAKLKLSIF